MDVWNPSSAVMPCNHGSEMRGHCLLPAFFRHTRVAFNYLEPIIAPVAIDAAQCPEDAACADNVRWLHEPSGISHIPLSRKCATTRCAQHAWVNMCGCGAKNRVHYDFVGIQGSIRIMYVCTTKGNVVTISRPTTRFLQASCFGL